MSTTKTSTYSSVFATPGPTGPVVPPGVVWPGDQEERRSFPAYDPSPPSTAQAQAAQQDSDCGSSSGLGGMTKHEGSSDTSSLESDARDSGGGGAGGGSIPAQSVVSGGTLPPAQPLPAGPHLYAAPPPRHWGTPSLQPPPTLAPPHPGHPLYTTTAPVYHGALVSSAVSSAAQGSNGPVPTTGAPSSGAGIPIVPGTSAGVPTSPPGAATTGLPPSIPPVPGAVNTTNGSNDLFVHVQPGETISLAVGSEVQHIMGPATIRMIGHSGLPPHALPLHVPRGHIIQQIVDEQGVLRHLILSPQTTPAPTSSRVSTSGSAAGPLPNGQLRSGATTPHKSNHHGASPKSASPPVIPPYPPPGIAGPATDYIDPATGHMVTPRKWSSPSTGTPDLKRSGADLAAVCNGAAVENGLSHCAIDDDDRERLLETLNGIQSPQVISVTARECDITWQELDTSEAAASGGPFPQIDASEFKYEIFLYEGAPNGTKVTQHRCEPSLAYNGLRLSRLKPSTDYFVNIRASLPERDLYGHPSSHVPFRTFAAKPDMPLPPTLRTRGATWVLVSWRPPKTNGAPIRNYFLQIAKGKVDPFDTVYDGGATETRIDNLHPGAHYRVRVIARNDIGNSDPSQPLHVTMSPTGSGSGSSPAPLMGQQIVQKPAPPTILFVSARSVRLSWAPLPDFAQTALEYAAHDSRSDYSRSSTYTQVAPDCYSGPSGTTATVNGLQSNREYRFRLVATTAAGESLRSDYVAVRTHKDRYENSNYNQNYYQQQNDRERVMTPTNLQRLHDDEETVEIGWKAIGRDVDGITYVVEATTLAAAASTSADGNADSNAADQPWRVCYRGSSTNAVINDPVLCLFRVQSIRRQVASSWSDTLFVKRQSGKKKQQKGPAEPVKPGACTAPRFASITASSMDISWKLQEAKKEVSAENAKEQSMIYELQRVDKQAITVYSGDATEYHLEHLRPVEHVQVRARAVIVDYEGKRLEGDWSSISSACTLCHAPSSPHQLHISTDSTGTKVLCWTSPAQLNGSEVTEYVIYATRTLESQVDSEEATQSAEERLGSVPTTEYPLIKLLPAHHYTFRVVAVNEGGPSERSEPLEYTTPAGAPEAPERFSVEALSTSELALTWHTPRANGSPLTGYKIAVHEIPDNSSQKQFVSRHAAPADATSFTVTGLKTETDYEVEIQAENAVGRSEKERLVCQTLAPPPEPPILCLSQAQANVLKLKWSNAPSSSKSEPNYYYLEKENENGTFSPVYEGETRTAKVKGLKECTAHRFRIRSALARLTIAGPWSTTYTFYTTRLPPPAVRAAPTITEISTGVFQIEWQPVRSALNGEETAVQQQFYRLQVAPKLGREKTVETWKTIYEGPATSYTLTVPVASASRQARVFVVQQRDGEEEALSLASPTAFFSAVPTPKDSPRKRPKPNAGNGVSGNSTPNSATTRSSSQLPRAHKVGLYRRFKKFLVWLKRTVSEKDCAFIVLAVFVFLAISIAVILNNYYEF